MFDALRSFICMVLSFIMGFSTFPMSFLPCKNQTDFTVETGAFSENEILLNSEKNAISINGNYTLDENGYLVDLSFNNDTSLSFDGLFCREINHFVDCVLNGTECIAPAEDGVEIMKILDAVYESARTGHEVVIG